MAKSGITHDQLEADFRQGRFKPLYLFHGEETFPMDELQKVLIAHALEPHERDFNLDVVYGFDITPQQLVARCSALPMMAARRVVIVREFDKLSGSADIVKAYAQNPNPHAVVLLVCSGKVNTNVHPFRAVRDNGVVVEFTSPYPDKMPAWILKRVQAAGYRMSPEAAALMAEFTGTQLRAAAAEIDKLITFAGGRTELKLDDVLQAGGQSREFNVFELQRAIGEGRLPDALTICDHLLRQASAARGEAIMIVSVLAGWLTRLWHMRLLRAAGVPDAAMAGRIGVNPYFLKDYAGALRRFTDGSLERGFAALLAADFELKGGREGSGSNDEWTILLLLLKRLTPV